jgi:hypothetical protein
MTSFKKVNIFRLKALAISLGQKWQRTQVGKKILATNEVRKACTQGGQVFFGGEGGGFGFPCAQHVPNNSSPYLISFALSST